MQEMERKDIDIEEKKKDGQRGALYVEATLSLSFFMFAIFTLLSVIQIAYTQARMAVALDCATKELAEYAHVFYATGLADTFGSGGGKSSELFNKLAEYMENLGGDIGTVDSELGQLITGAGTALRGDSISTFFETETGKVIAKQFMKKNMVNGSGDTAEAFMKRNHIQSMNLDGSKFLEGGNDVFMQVNYDVEVVKLLNLNIVFHMSHCSYTQAWGNGE